MIPLATCISDVSLENVLKPLEKTLCLLYYTFVWKWFYEIEHR